MEEAKPTLHLVSFFGHRHIDGKWNFTLLENKCFDGCSHRVLKTHRANKGISRTRQNKLILEVTPPSVEEKY